MMAAKTTQRLAPSLNLMQGTVIAISMVVGSGILLLPGIVYQTWGRASLSVWISAAILILPFVLIFSWLGRYYPDAGGIAFYARQAFPAWIGGSTEILMIASNALQMAVTAMTGGIYFAAAVGGGSFTTTTIALTLLGIAGLVNLRRVHLSQRLQLILVLCFISLLVVISLTVLLSGRWHDGEGIALVGWWQQPSTLPVLPLVLFGLFGWEKFCSATEEYRGIRTFPLAVTLSFITVMVTYLVLTSALAIALPRTNANIVSTPVYLLLEYMIGPVAGRIIAALALVIVLSNIIAVTFSNARVVFSSSRAGLFPPVLGQLNTKTHVPDRAVIITVALFALTTLLPALGVLSLTGLIALKVYLTLTLYVINIASFLKLSYRTMRTKRVKPPLPNPALSLPPLILTPLPTGCSASKLHSLLTAVIQKWGGRAFVTSLPITQKSLTTIPLTDKVPFQHFFNHILWPSFTVILMHRINGLCLGGDKQIDILAASGEFAHSDTALRNASLEQYFVAFAKQIAMPVMAVPSDILTGCQDGAEEIQRAEATYAQLLDFLRASAAYVPPSLEVMERRRPLIYNCLRRYDQTLIKRQHDLSASHHEEASDEKRTRHLQAKHARMVLSGKPRRVYTRSLHT